MKKSIAPLMLLTLLSAGVVYHSQAAQTSPVTQSSAVTVKLNINDATQSQLESVPGIGPAKAAAIIEYRNAIGSFTSVTELTNVTGIGEKTLRKLSQYLTV
ncbi:ComEA family DNA-binding protein [Aestuariibacter salexigens]|uniref:ComEA family DNA-binding protein n=1 Tax=Aestuariibacter salexigens TaxID=226010 RepID=UPI0004790D53|nr:helix-hairpin-helix domain-containing protein [Aestuariibacter salexigens]